MSYRRLTIEWSRRARCPCANTSPRRAAHSRSLGGAQRLRLRVLLAGALRSTAVTPLPRYAGPSASRADRSTRYVFRADPQGTTPSPPGLSGSSTSLSECAVPLYPGKPEDLHLPMPSYLVQASPNPAGWPVPSLRFEASSVGGQRGRHPHRRRRGPGLWPQPLLRPPARPSGFCTLVTISTSGAVTDRFGVGNAFDALAWRATSDIAPRGFTSEIRSRRSPE